MVYAAVVIKNKEKQKKETNKQTQTEASITGSNFVTSNNLFMKFMHVV